MFKNDLRTERVHFRVTKEEKEYIKELAEKENLNITKFIFKCIEFYLSNK